MIFRFNARLVFLKLCLNLAFHLVYRSYAHSNMYTNLGRKISSVYMSSECYSNKDNKFHKTIRQCPLKRLNNLFQKIRQLIKRLAHVPWWKPWIKTCARMFTINVSLAKVWCVFNFFLQFYHCIMWSKRRAHIVLIYASR